MKRLTQRDIDAAWKQRGRTRQVLHDSNPRGLQLIVNEQSASWVFSYKPRGLDPATGKRPGTRHIRIGTACEAGGAMGTHSLEEARAAAIALKAQILAGRDPRQDQEIERAQRAAAARSAKLSQDLLDDYERSVKTRVRSEAHAANQKTQVRLALELMGLAAAPPSAITRKAALDMVEKSPPGIRRARLGALDRFLRWCVDRDYLENVVTAQIDRQNRPAPPPARDRWLSLEELAKVWKAAGDLEHQVLGDLVQFLIAVPARRDEAASLEWDQLSLAGALDKSPATKGERRDPRWHQPSAKTKNGLPHDVPLNAHALAILRRRKVATKGKGLVFPAPRSKGVYLGWSKLKAALGEASGVKNWRLHDLRRTFASWVAERGVSDTVADMLLNHAQAATRGGVLGVYQRGERWAERVQAMNIWSNLIDEALGRADSNVVRLAKVKA